MKNILNLVIAVLMMAFTALGAKAQFNDAAIFRMAGTVNNQVNYLVGTVAEEHIKEADLAPLKGSLEARKRFLDSYTSTQVLDGKITFYRPNGRLIEKDTTLTARVLNVRKLKADARYNGVVAVLYGFNPSFSDPAPYVVVGYEEKAAAQTTPQGGGQGAQVQGGQPQPGSGQPAPYQPLYTFQDSLGVKYTVLYNPNGAPFVMGPNGQVQATTQTAPQGGGQGGQQKAATAQDSTTRSATWSQSLTTSGDPNLLAQMGTPGSQGGQQKAGTATSQEEIVIKEVNGVERAYIRQADGTLKPDDANSDLAVVEAGKGRNFVFAGGEAEAGNMRNAHKFGMNDAAGYSAPNYGKHGGTGSKVGDVVWQAACPGMGWAPYGQGGWIFQGGVYGGVGGQISQQVLINGGYAPGAQQVPRYGPYWRNPGARY